MSSMVGAAFPRTIPLLSVHRSATLILMYPLWSSTHQCIWAHALCSGPWGGRPSGSNDLSQPSCPTRLPPFLFWN